jgi:hypothetical protein
MKRAYVLSAKVSSTVILLVSLAAYGGPGSAISQLNADLVPIYEILMKEERPTNLVGKRLNLTLNLKYASDRHLLFTDTQVVIDKDTKYCTPASLTASV